MPCKNCIIFPDKPNWKPDKIESISNPKFKRGDYVEKISGAAWSGKIVGTYSTRLTPEGYCVESIAHPGSVQIYPAKALVKIK